jgi:hypothetical protein
MRQAGALIAVFVFGIFGTAKAVVIPNAPKHASAHPACCININNCAQEKQLCTVVSVVQPKGVVKIDGHKPLLIERSGQVSNLASVKSQRAKVIVAERSEVSRFKRAKFGLNPTLNYRPRRISGVHQNKSDAIFNYIDISTYDARSVGGVELVPRQNSLTPNQESLKRTHRPKNTSEDRQPKGIIGNPVVSGFWGPLSGWRWLPAFGGFLGAGVLLIGVCGTFNGWRL